MGGRGGGGGEWRENSLTLVQEEKCVGILEVPCPDTPNFEQLGKGKHPVHTQLCY